ncbi:MAG: GFA family protein [Acidisphaera sp.]|nr:GFA family protein [Acidisphaera sp.]MBV9812612.1 GFA family protein [Acetobacteraceae bacterium]
MSSVTEQHGGCNCGRVRFVLRGEPIRAGVCHCLTCRKETGGPFMAFLVFDRDAVTIRGETRSWIAATDHRHFCADCGSRLFGTHDSDREVEIRLGALDDAPSGSQPAYELWTPRREHWLTPVAGATQHPGNRPQ